MSRQPRPHLQHQSPRHAHQYHHQHHQQQHEVGYYSSSRDSIAYINRAANVSSAASELDLSRKARRKDLRNRLKLPSSVALASSGEGPLLGAWRTAPGSTAGTNPPSSNHLNSNSSCNGTERCQGDVLHINFIIMVVVFPQIVYFDSKFMPSSSCSVFMAFIPQGGDEYFNFVLSGVG
ncbi:unnamed protein product [Psylliodes chrysocephalus]|uniref:Uncharacterized protein n=1 Tax=Psylliodes chrysocephalus TaxID=3402493 RepID=A0A9P0GCI2_9CUCU|nr:unnamed protein product [Psylliodes chrysocephala]